MASTRLPVCTPARAPSFAISGRGIRRRTVRSGGSSIMASLRALFHRRERGRLQDRVADGGDDRAVFLGLGARREPVWIRHESRPLLLALGERLPLQKVVEVHAGFADQHGPEARLADAMLLPKLERNSIEALQQVRQATRHTMIDAQFIDHLLCPLLLGARLSSAQDRSASRALRTACLRLAPACPAPPGPRTHFRREIRARAL